MPPPAQATQRAQVVAAPPAPSPATLTACCRSGAARHGRRPRDDDLMARGPLGHQLRSTGWRLAGYDDGPEQFLAVAERGSRG